MSETKKVELTVTYSNESISYNDQLMQLEKQADEFWAALGEDDRSKVLGIVYESVQQLLDVESWVPQSTTIAPDSRLFVDFCIHYAEVDPNVIDRIVYARQHPEDEMPRSLKKKSSLRQKLYARICLFFMNRSDGYSLENLIVRKREKNS